jgi:holliday junction DNA helicase RuvA
VIASLRGTVAEKEPDSIVIDVGGVGYAVTLTASAMRAVPAVGSQTRLFIYTHAIQDSPWQLYGFSEPEERRVFETLLAVQGVGPRVAVAILSGLPISELVRAITGGDVARLTQIRGVGRKIAERLTVELRDKIALVASGMGRDSGVGTSAPTVVPSGRLGEVHAALLALGYRPPEFETVLSKLDAKLPAPDLVKQALAALRKR